LKNKFYEFIRRTKGKLWGEDGRYSQVNLIFQDRILDDSISRTFLVVEAEINPLTFEMIRDNGEEFKDNEIIRQLLGKADYRGKFGYVICSYEKEFRNKKDMEKTQYAVEYTTEAIVLMHRFVMRVLRNLNRI
jgi:hypothetical protein